MKNLLMILICCLSGSMLLAQVCPSGGSIPSGGTSSAVGNFGGGYNNFNLSSLQGFANDIYTGQYLSSVQDYDQMNGSPFLTKEASSATLVMNDGKLHENVPLKYDLYKKEIIATKPDGNDIVLDSRYYKEILINVDGQDISFKKVNPKNPDKYYEVIYESGDVVFFKDQSAILRKGENLGITKSISSFTQSSRYYVTGEDNSIAKVNLKKRDVFDHLPEMEAVAMREYIKTAKIKLKAEKDYKQLFAAMDDDD